MAAVSRPLETIQQSNVTEMKDFGSRVRECHIARTETDCGAALVKERPASGFRRRHHQGIRGRHTGNGLQSAVGDAGGPALFTHPAPVLIVAHQTGGVQGQVGAQSLQVQQTVECAPAVAPFFAKDRNQRVLIRPVFHDADMVDDEVAGSENASAGDGHGQRLASGGQADNLVFAVRCQRGGP